MGDVKVPDLNRVFLAGRLTRDPELRYTAGGMAYCKVGIANTSYFKDKDGNRAERTCFVDVTLWGPSAEYAGERYKKGRPVLVEGSLRTNEWEDRESGQKRTKLELNAQRLTALDWDEDGRSRGGSPQGGGSQGGASSGGQTASGGGSSRPQPRVIEEPIPEDDIPF